VRPTAPQKLVARFSARITRSCLGIRMILPPIMNLRSGVSRWGLLLYLAQRCQVFLETAFWRQFFRSHTGGVGSEGYNYQFSAGLVQVTGL